MADAGSGTLDLPPEFVRLNKADPVWLRGLPDLLDGLARRWSLKLETHFPLIAYNYVAPATRFDSERTPMPCVLKVSRHAREAANEIAALRLWAGCGAARLIEADPELGALLVERIEPGTMLVDVAETDDDEATLVAASVLRQLWEPVLESADMRGLRPLESWCAAYDRNREALTRGVDGFPVALFQHADALRRDLLASTSRPTVLHGDMHHYNVLRDHRGGWLAIDPKGLAGDRCFDVCQFFRNPRDGPSPQLNRRRLDIFCTELGLARQRTKDWCLVHAVLDACWGFEGHAAREANGALLHERRLTTQADKPWHRAVEHAEAALSL